MGAGAVAHGAEALAAASKLVAVLAEDMSVAKTRVEAGLRAASDGFGLDKVCPSAFRAAWRSMGESGPTPTLASGPDAVATQPP